MDPATSAAPPLSAIHGLSLVVGELPFTDEFRPKDWRRYRAALSAADETGDRCGLGIRRLRHLGLVLIWIPARTDRETCEVKCIRPPGTFPSLGEDIQHRFGHPTPGHQLNAQTERLRPQGELS